MGFFSWLWNGLRQLLGLILPIFAQAADFRAYSRTTRWILHGLMLLVILVLLWILQQFVLFDTRNWMPDNPYLQPIWIPVFFLLVYTLIWLIWWSIVDGGSAPSQFPDIDFAWEEAKRALQKREIDLQAVPLFLVLGRPLGGEESLFGAARLPFTLQQVPHPDAPIQVWANKHDGIFVTCMETSRLSSSASYLAATGGSVIHFNPDGTVMIGIGSSTQFNKSDLISLINGNTKLPQEEKRRRLDALHAEDDPENADIATARLEHLCRLMVRDRLPKPPANGILVLIPYSATQNDQAAELTSSDCQQDLDSVLKVFKLHCPLFALVCDLETVPGFAAYLDAYRAPFRTEEEKRNELKKRLGKRLKWGVGLAQDKRQSLVKKLVQWIGGVLFPFQIYKHYLQVKTLGREGAADQVQHNYQLYRFLSTMCRGRERLTSIVVDGLVSKTRGPDMLGGCYLAATGRDAAKEQAFVAGIFERLIESAYCGTWSEEALEEDGQYQRWTGYGYIALPIFVVATIGLLVYFW